jgi:hypothetical protein
VNQEKRLTQDEAQGIGRRFLLNRYPSAKITFNKVMLATKEAAPLYHLEGDIKIPSGSLISQLLWPSKPYTFKIQVSALEGKVLNWELE